MTTHERFSRASRAAAAASAVVDSKQNNDEEGSLSYHKQDEVGRSHHEIDEESSIKVSVKRKAKKARAGTNCYIMCCDNDLKTQGDLLMEYRMSKVMEESQKPSSVSHVQTDPKSQNHEYLARDQRISTIKF